MAKFQIAGIATSGPLVTFSAEIDKDGDFLVRANGVKLFYIDHESGELHTFGLDPIEGLNIANGSIVCRR